MIFSGSMLNSFATSFRAASGVCEGPTSSTPSARTWAKKFIGSSGLCDQERTLIFRPYYFSRAGKGCIYIAVFTLYVGLRAVE